MCICNERFMGISKRIRGQTQMSDYKKAYKKLSFIKRWKLKPCVSLIRLHNSMHWYIVSKDLFEDFMKFDKDFNGDVIDKIKQERRGKLK